VPFDSLATIDIRSSANDASDPLGGHRHRFGRPLRNSPLPTSAAADIATIQAWEIPAGPEQSWQPGCGSRTAASRTIEVNSPSAATTAWR
jgi:hypothetical protein